MTMMLDALGNHVASLIVAAVGGLIVTALGIMAVIYFQSLGRNVTRIADEAAAIRKMLETYKRGDDGPQARAQTATPKLR